ncbi:hypothetical protein SAMN06265347_10450 [Halobellus salinus]|nr:hypothetical protein SAMN06265347_10450 [Halobellus salinus]
MLFVTKMGQLVQVISRLGLAALTTLLTNGYEKCLTEV